MQAAPRTLYAPLVRRTFDRAAPWFVIVGSLGILAPTIRGEPGAIAPSVPPPPPEPDAEQAKLVAADGAAEDWFGYYTSAVSIDADTAVVGTPKADLQSGADLGAAYVFVRV